MHIYIRTPHIHMGSSVFGMCCRQMTFQSYLEERIRRFVDNIVGGIYNSCVCVCLYTQT